MLDLLRPYGVCRISDAGSDAKALLLNHFQMGRSHVPGGDALIHPPSARRPWPMAAASAVRPRAWSMQYSAPPSTQPGYYTNMLGRTGILRTGQNAHDGRGQKSIQSAHQAWTLDAPSLTTTCNSRTGEQGPRRSILRSEQFRGTLNYTRRNDHH